MKEYIGTKKISAKPMSRGEYNEYRGWDVPEDENPEDLGYLVEYQDGGDSNHSDHDGYISWSPKEQFENAYQDISEGVSFGHALVLLKEGKKVARKGWNGKGMWLILVPGTDDANIKEGTPYALAGLKGATNILPHIDMYTVNSKGRRAMLPGWLASQIDMLSDDWVIVD